MRRAAAALAVVALAGCGHERKRAAPHVTPSATKQADRVTKRAMEAVRKSNLPDDAKRELEEAAELLEKSR